MSDCVVGKDDNRHVAIRRRPRLGPWLSIRTPYGPRGGHVTMYRRRAAIHGIVLGYRASDSCLHNAYACRAHGGRFENRPPVQRRAAPVHPTSTASNGVHSPPLVECCGTSSYGCGQQSKIASSWPVVDRRAGGRDQERSDRHRRGRDVPKKGNIDRHSMGRLMGAQTTITSVSSLAGLSLGPPQTDPFLRRLVVYWRMADTQAKDSPPPRACAAVRAQTRLSLRRTLIDIRRTGCTEAASRS